MRLITTVYNALAEFRDGCTRKQLEDVTGLCKDEVHKGLLGLRRRRMLLILGDERERVHYRLKPGSAPPVDLRGGRHDEEAAQPALIFLDTFFDNGYRAAKPPSSRAAPGALRTTRRSLAAAAPVNSTCLLANVWRKR